MNKSKINKIIKELKSLAKEDFDNTDEPSIIRYFYSKKEDKLLSFRNEYPELGYVGRNELIYLGNIIWPPVQLMGEWKDIQKSNWYFDFIQECTYTLSLLA